MAAATLVTATGSLLEGGIRGAVPRPGEDRETVTSAVVERVRVPADLVREIAAVPGVGAVAADVSFPAYLVVDGEQVAGHWASLAEYFDEIDMWRVWRSPRCRRPDAVSPSPGGCSWQGARSRRATRP
jgi:hypothetical protein